jgi:ankyrin repeat protein
MLKKILLSLLLAATQMQAVIDINGKGVNKQALFFGACSTGNHELAKLLIQAGVNVNHEANDQHGWSPIRYAIHRNDIEMVKMLLNAGINVNAIESKYGITALSWAMQASQKEIVLLLINAGANVNFTDSHGVSVLSRAIRSQNIDVVKILLNAGAVVDNTLMNSLTQSSNIICNLSLPILEILIEAGLNINYQIDNKSVCQHGTLLSLCVQNNAHKFIQYLLTLNNIDVNLVNCQGKTAFDIACEKGNIQIIELFQSYFAAQEDKASLSQTQQTTETSVITIANDTNTQLNVLHQVEVPAHSKAVITTDISKI